TKSEQSIVDSIHERLNSDAMILLYGVLLEPEFSGYAAHRDDLTKAFPDQSMPALQPDFVAEIKEVFLLEEAEAHSSSVNKRVGRLLNAGLTLILLYLTYAIISLPFRYKGHAKFLLMTPSHRTQASLYGFIVLIGILAAALPFARIAA